MIAELKLATRAEEFDFLVHIVEKYRTAGMTNLEIRLGVQAILNNTDSMCDLFYGIKIGRYNIETLGGKEFYRVADVLICYFKNLN